MNPLPLWTGAVSVSVPSSVTVTPDTLALTLALETSTIVIGAAITPDVFELVLTLETSTVLILGSVTVTPDALALALTLETPTSSGMNTFPTLSTGPSDKVFSDERDPEVVSVRNAADGYPVLNKLFTFDPRTFRYEERFVSNADKLTLTAFYDANKDAPFNWTNDQDDTEYEVIFLGPPGCRVDGEKDVWRIFLELKQNAPVI